MTALSSHRRAALAAEKERTHRRVLYDALDAYLHGIKPRPQPVVIVDAAGRHRFTIGGHPIDNTVEKGSVLIVDAAPNVRRVDLTLIVDDLTVVDDEEAVRFHRGVISNIEHEEA